MKIIATVGHDEFLVQATSHELARCMGYSYDSSIPAAHRLMIGQEINVSESYETLTSVIGSSKELADAKDKLKSTVSAIERAQRLIEPKAALVKSKMPE